MVWLMVAGLCAVACARGQGEAAAVRWPEGATDTWHGYTRHQFTVAGCPAWVVEPKQAAPGRPWSWCLEFPDAFTERCAAPKSGPVDGIHSGHA